jgi:hypothetical protein
MTWRENLPKIYRDAASLTRQLTIEAAVGLVNKEDHWRIVLSLGIGSSSTIASYPLNIDATLTLVRAR